MNTRINYMYRDASNYKESGSVVFAGAITAVEREMILSNLCDGEDFIPAQVGLEHLGERMTSFPSADDHCFHELTEDDIVLTHDAPTDGRTISEFAAEFARAEWDAAAYAITEET